MSAYLLLIPLMVLLCHVNKAEYVPWVDEFEHWSYLDDDDQCALYWTPHIDDCSIEIGLEFATSGWAGFGLSLSGNMFPADVVIGWIDDNAEDEDDGVYLFNYYTTNFVTPTLFNDQNGIELIEGWQQDINGTMTTFLRFEKELFAAQYRENGVDVSVGTTRTIFAFNQNDPLNNDPMAIQGHVGNNRGPKSLNLLVGETKSVPLPEDVKYIDLLGQQIEVPSQHTTYYCTLLELPDLPDVVHTVRIDPIIQHGNEGIVHHFLLNVCRNIQPEYINQGFDCDDTANMPTNASHCPGGYTMYAWAVGGGNFNLPEGVGIEIGGTAADAVHYIELQTHFDNPWGDEDFIDSSGLRLWYTPTLREESAAVLWVADALDQFVPHGIQTVYNYAYFKDSCSDALPEGGVQVFANFYHAHLLGRQGKIRHIRDGEELPPIDQNLAYDFDFQQYVPLEEHITILPGDEIIVECVYDSTERHNMTIGGEASTAEMCMTFLAVYPKSNVGLTWTQFIPHERTQFFIDAAENGYYDPSNGLYNVTVDGALDFYNRFQQTPQRRSTCFDLIGDEIANEVIEIPAGFKTYDGDDYFGCIGGEEDDDFEWDEWYGILLIAAIVIVGLLILFMIYRLCKRTKSDDKQEMYRQVVSENKGGEQIPLAQKNEYGATK